MRVTIRDVAVRAGVSPMSVSAVLNGAGGRKVSVAPEKAERIRQAARDLRYQTNHMARSFRRGQTGQVAVVFQRFGRFTTHSTYRGDVMNGVMEALFPADYTLSLCPRLIREGNPNFISDGRFDGVLWCRPDLTEDGLLSLQEATVPVVMLHAPPGSVLGVSTYCADNDLAMRRVVNHLKELGHERIAYVIDPVSVHSVEGQARGRALAIAGVRAGLPEPQTVVLPKDHSFLDECAKPDGPFTALVCFSDELAGFILSSCEERGIEVPRQFSVVGFDSSPLCETTRPRLTSVNQPVERMAFEATTNLLALIRGAEAGETASAVRSTLYDCPLDVRSSTGPSSSR